MYRMQTLKQVTLRVLSTSSRDLLRLAVDAADKVHPFGVEFLRFPFIE